MIQLQRFISGREYLGGFHVVNGVWSPYGISPVDNELWLCAHPLAVSQRGAVPTSAAMSAIFVPGTVSE